MENVLTFHCRSSASQSCVDSFIYKWPVFVCLFVFVSLSQLFFLGNLRVTTKLSGHQNVSFALWCRSTQCPPAAVSSLEDNVQRAQAEVCPVTDTLPHKHSWLVLIGEVQTGEWIIQEPLSWDNKIRVMCYWMTWNNHVFRRQKPTCQQRNKQWIKGAVCVNRVVCY